MKADEAIEVLETVIFSSVPAPSWLSHYVLRIGLYAVPSRTITLNFEHALICYVIARRWTFRFLFQRP